MNYNIEFKIKGYPDYGITNKGIFINLKSKRILKKIVLGYTKGYYINGKFKSLNSLRKLLFKNTNDDFCPF